MCIAKAIQKNTTQESQGCGKSTTINEKYTVTYCTSTDPSKNEHTNTYGT